MLIVYPGDGHYIWPKWPEQNTPHETTQVKVDKICVIALMMVKMDEGYALTKEVVTGKTNEKTMQ